MLFLVLFISLGYAVSTNSRPFHLAAVFAIIQGVFTLMFGGGVGDTLITTVFYFVYASIVYFIIDQFGDGIIMYFVITLCGALGLYFVPLLFS